MNNNIAPRTKTSIIRCFFYWLETFYYKARVNKVCEPDDYDNIYEYRISYYKDNQNTLRGIEIVFSKERETLRCYYIFNSGKSSKINRIEMNIYSFNNHFYTLFKYKGYNYDIEGSELTEKEFIDLISSIVRD